MFKAMKVVALSQPMQTKKAIKVKTAALPAYAHFMKSRISQVNGELDAAETASTVAEEWSKLSDEQKKPFFDAEYEDLTRFQLE